MHLQLQKGKTERVIYKNEVINLNNDASVGFVSWTEDRKVLAALKVPHKEITMQQQQYRTLEQTFTQVTEDNRVSPLENCTVTITAIENRTQKLLVLNHYK